MPYSNVGFAVVIRYTVHGNNRLIDLDFREWRYAISIYRSKTNDDRKQTILYHRERLVILKNELFNSNHFINCPLPKR